MRKIKHLLILSFFLVSQVQAAGSEADDLRGGWMADVEGVRHIYILKILGTEVTGLYCTDCGNPDDLSFIEEGLLDGAELSFRLGQDLIHGRLVDGNLHLSNTDMMTNIVLQRSLPVAPVNDGQVVAAKPAPRPPATVYEPPGPAELITLEKIVGLWLWGNGPAKQHFIFRQAGDDLLGMVCGPCDDPGSMTLLDHISIDGVHFHFNIAHQDWGSDIANGPYNNVSAATLSQHEMHMLVTNDNAPEKGAAPMTLLGPIRY